MYRRDCGFTGSLLENQLPGVVPLNPRVLNPTACSPTTLVRVAKLSNNKKEKNAVSSEISDSSGNPERSDKKSICPSKLALALDQISTVGIAGESDTQQNPGRNNRLNNWG
jgi:hypothetical protein